MSNNTLNVDQFIVRDRILSDLRCGTCTVVFTKADGSERTMLCTLKEELIPKNKHHDTESDQPTTAPVKKKSENNVPVWDLEKNGWRSFNVTSLIHWKQESPN